MKDEKIEKILDILLSTAIDIKKEVGPKRISPRRKRRISRALVNRLIALERLGISKRRHKQYREGLKDLIEILGERLLHRLMYRAKEYVTQKPDTDFTIETIKAMEDKFLDMVFSGVYDADAPKRSQLISSSRKRTIKKVRKEEQTLFSQLDGS